MRLAILIVTILLAIPLAAADRYLRIPVDQLGIPETAWEGIPGYDWGQPALLEDARAEGPAEVRLADPRQEGGNWWSLTPLRRSQLLARVPAEATEVRGVLLGRAGDGLRLIRVPFAVPVARMTADAEAEAAFRQAGIARLQWAVERGLPGSAWFRHRLAQLGVTVAAADQRVDRDLDEMDLFTGARAVAENLQLERGLLPSDGGAETVALDTLEGITIAAMDWKPLLLGRNPQADRLAAVVPADQHAVFVPSFAALLELVDRVDTLAAPLLQGMTARAEDAGTAARYQRQLCLEPTELARRFGPQVIESVALTGGDPFLRTGSDVAVLFLPRQAALLQAFIAQKHVAAVAAGARAVSGNVRGVAWTGAVSEDLAVRSYLAQVGPAVVVTNSLVQLGNLVAVAQGAPALAGEDEYRFFRDRYAASPDELALVVVPDAAIRRWCSPRWRIGEARRTRAIALLSELHVRQAAALGAGTPPAIDAAGLDLAGLGQLTVAGAAIRSATYGTLGFATPLAELPLVRCTEEEAARYRRWRDGYAASWRDVFDPIALHISRRGDTLRFDLTVIPLIVGSEYREMIALVGDQQLAPTAGDPHPGTLWHWCMALDPQSRPVQQLSGMMRGMLGERIDPLGWLGRSLAVWADDGPFWQELAAVEEAEAFVERSLARLPVAARIEVADTLGCAAFLTAVRTLVEGSAPGSVSWETREVDGVKYVRVAENRRVDPDDEGARSVMAVYYALAGGGLVLSFDEAVVRAAVQRAAGAPAKEPRWLGRQVGARAALAGDGAGHALRLFASRQAQRQLRVRSWDNLPILNAWKHLLPDQDPVVVHERVFGVRPVCPGGGTYVWDAAAGTMRSTVYGDPADPLPGPDLARWLADLAAAEAGLGFEHGGLRAVLELRTGVAPR